MTIDKLPSGSFRIRQMDNGKVYQLTVKHKPSKAEAIRLMADKIAKTPKNTPGMTFRTACDAYLASKKNILSPTTYRMYSDTIKIIPDDFLDKNVYQITPIMVQTVVNDWAKDKAPKTVKNYASFIMTVFKSADIDIKQPQLPQMIKKLPYIPSEDDVKAIAEKVIGTDLEIPLSLAIRGLRRSEMVAITPKDIKKTDDGYVLTINKAMVQNVDKEWVIKTTKTTDSTRTIPLPADLAEKIIKQGCVFTGKPYEINMELHKVQDSLGIPRFSLHKYRHFFASFLSQQGYTDLQISQAGGWKDGSIVLSKNYKHALEMEKAKKAMDADISKLFVTN